MGPVTSLCHFDLWWCWKSSEGKLLPQWFKIHRIPLVVPTPRQQIWGTETTNGASHLWIPFTNDLISILEDGDSCHRQPRKDDCLGYTMKMHQTHRLDVLSQQEKILFRKLLAMSYLLQNIVLKVLLNDLWLISLSVGLGNKPPDLNLTGTILALKPHTGPNTYQNRNKDLIHQQPSHSSRIQEGI